ncbi:hypothetical protein B0H12DRAFT_1074783 [Mycena haematopus]|nr:hypothetical protein B0H12DRAFT_1074783 [Mycena haematopus]
MDSELYARVQEAAGLLNNVQLPIRLGVMIVRPPDYEYQRPAPLQDIPVDAPEGFNVHILDHPEVTLRETEIGEITQTPRAKKKNRVLIVFLGLLGLLFIFNQIILYAFVQGLFSLQLASIRSLEKAFEVTRSAQVAGSTTQPLSISSVVDVPSTLPVPTSPMGAITCKSTEP